jgi:thiol-disulfide isomerase/thioredoxin
VKKLLAILTLSVFCGTSSAAVRKWTVADGSTKPFDGEFTAVQDRIVTIRKKSGRRFFVPLAALSQEDRDFIAAEEKAKAEAAVLAEAAARLKTTGMAKAVIGRTVKLDRKKLKKCDVFAAKAPEYYLLYWGGSWCPACRDAAPQLAKDYNETISRGKNIEAVHLNCDQTPDKMLEFMSDMKLTFPGIPLDQWQKDKLLKSMEPAQLPHYKLVDAAGMVIAEGEAAKSKARELAGGSGDAAATTAEKK